MPDGTKLGEGQAARRGVRRDDPRRGRARDRHRARGDHGPRRRRSRRARRWPACCRSPPTCSSSRSRPTAPTAWASTASRARSTPPPARRWRRRRGREDLGTRGRRSRASRSSSRPRDLCPRFTARAFEDVTIGPSPPWLKARLMAAGQRPINNVVDITNYVMLLAGQPAARLRPRPRRRRRGSSCAGRATASRSTTLDGQVRTLDAEMLVIDDADGPTSIAGVMGGARSEVHAGDHARADGGRQLGRPQHPPHLAGPGPAQRGQRALREGPGARAGDGGPDRRHAADARADRRAPRARDDRRRRRRPARQSSSACASSASRSSSGVPIAAPAPGRDPARAGLRRRGGARTASTCGARLPAQRRHARGRPHRGGRAHRRPREAAGHAAQAPRQRRAPERPAAPAPPRDRRARRAAACTRSWAGASPSPGWPTGCAWPPTTRAGASWPSRTR